MSRRNCWLLTRVVYKSRNRQGFIIVLIIRVVDVACFMAKKFILQRLCLKCGKTKPRFSSRRRHTRLQGDWSSDVCSSDHLLGSAKLTLSSTPACLADGVGEAMPKTLTRQRSLCAKAAVNSALCCGIMIMILVNFEDGCAKHVIQASECLAMIWQEWLGRIPIFGDVLTNRCILVKFYA